MIQGKATVDAHLNVFIFFLCLKKAQEEFRIFDVGFFVARSDYDGQCEGLRLWDGRLVLFPRLFYVAIEGDG